MPEIKAAGYSVSINKSIAAGINRFFRLSKEEFSSIFILVDENSLQHCYPQLAEQIGYFRDAEIIEIESGEENKTLEVCAQIWSTLSEYGADRKSLFVNLGGGVICDMGGFIASTFKRGIRFIHIPTTLLAQVDASVGGKTGIDLGHLKNEVGVFSHPAAVFINSDFIRTLPGRQLVSGFAEIIKHALIADAAYWKKIQKLKPDDLSGMEALIQRSIKIKNAIVLEDPMEKGKRRILNFGHTIGHAVESLSLAGKDPLLHGEAIAVGMICESYLSHKINGLSKPHLESITRFILKTFPKVAIKSMDRDKLLELMQHDKKNENGKIGFVLLSAIGDCGFSGTVKKALILEALDYYVTESTREQ